MDYQTLTYAFAYLAWSGLWGCVLASALDEILWPTKGLFFADLGRGICLMLFAGIAFPVALVAAVLNNLVRLVVK